MRCRKILTILSILGMLLSGSLPQITADSDETGFETDLFEEGTRDLKIPGSRPFYLGMTPLAYDITQSSQDDVYDMLRDHGDIIAHHFDGGIPWPEAYDNTSFHANVMDNLNERVQKTPSGHETYLAITPISGTRDGLSLYWEANENMDRPGAWDARDFDSPEIITAYTNFCRYMIQKFQPKYLAYGIEVNILAESNPASYDRFVVLVEEVYPILKREFPTIPLILSLHIDSYANNKAAQTVAINKILPYTDYIAISTYPYLAYPDPSTIPSDWFTQLADLAPEKPFAIAETGFMAEDFNVTNPPINVPGNEQWQLEYVGLIFNETEKLDGRFITWFVPWDYDAMWIVIEPFVPFYVKMWRDTGLVNGTGVPRPSLALWDTWLGLPLISPNDPPIIINMSPKQTGLTINENETVNLTLEVFDEDHANISYLWKIDGSDIGNWDNPYYPYHADFNSSGNHTLNVTIDDNGIPPFELTFQWDIEVLNVNRGPVLGSYEPELVHQVDEIEDGQVNFTVNASDPDGDTLSYRWFVGSNERPGVTGPVLEFPFDHSSAGDHAIRVLINDSMDEISLTWSLNITDVNRAPEIIEFSPNEVHWVDEVENGTVEFSVNATDPDGDLVEYQWGLDGMDIEGETDSTYVFDLNYSSAGMYLVSLTVGDGDLSVDINWTLNINDTNRAPFFKGEPPKNVTVGELYSYDVLAWDPDPEDVIEYSIMDPPTNMTIDGATGRIAWTPTKDQVGSFEVTVSITDGNISVTQIFTVRVLPLPWTNGPPTITDISDQSLIVDRILEIQVTALDPDPWDDVNISFYLVDAPEGMRIGDRSGHISWRPKRTDIGTVTVIVGVTDGKANSTTTFSIEVLKKEGGNTGTEDPTPMLIGVLIIIILVVVVLVFMMFRKKKDMKGEDEGPEEHSEDTGPQKEEDGTEEEKEGEQTTKIEP